MERKQLSGWTKYLCGTLKMGQKIKIRYVSMHRSLTHFSLLAFFSNTSFPHLRLLLDWSSNNHWDSERTSLLASIQRKEGQARRWDDFVHQSVVADIWMWLQQDTSLYKWRSTSSAKTSNLSRKRESRGSSIRTHDSLTLRKTIPPQNQSQHWKTRTLRPIL